MGYLGVRYLAFDTFTSRMAYWNSFVYGPKGYVISELQLCQNNASRIFSLRPKHDHVTPVMKDLHRLPAEQIIEYKMLVHN